MKTKFIFVTGGVVSSLGKGIMASSVGQLLKNRGFKVFMQKFDPYINVDPGNMSPYQHGEVFVTDDGAETDLDLGHYERFLDENLSKESSVSTGKIYSKVIEKERKGYYEGATIQVIPHITNQIKQKLIDAANSSKADVIITEIGGTVGDIESLPFLEAIRQTRRDFGYENTLYIHTTLLPFLKAANEIKTKPTQHSVSELRSLGISPDMIVLRSEVPVSTSVKEKIASFCDVNKENVYESYDVDIIYKMILNLKEQHIDDHVINHFKLEPKRLTDLSEWEALIERISQLKKTVTIGLVGKYVSLHDAYLSVYESLKHAGYHLNRHVQILWLNSEKITSENVAHALRNVDGIIVPGGFGKRGTEGKLASITYAREQNIPLFGICLGLQLALIEFGRNVIGIKDATSSEFHPHTKYAVIDKLSPHSVERIGVPYRLGLFETELKAKTLVRKLYGKQRIKERHRHEYAFNKEYLRIYQDHGLVFSGFNSDIETFDIVEYPKNDFFVGCQFHPEFLSRPLRPHPLFCGFVRAVKKYNKEKNNR